MSGPRTRLALLLAIVLGSVPAAAAGFAADQPRQRAALPGVLPGEMHCLAGCPTGAPATNRVIRRAAYALSNNGATKLADWVAYTVRPVLPGPARRRNWSADLALPEDETLEPPDYADAHAWSGLDRGHLAPLASLTGDAVGVMANHLSNVVPQKSALNRGPWAALEAAVRRAARITGTPVHVLAGPLFERAMPPLPGADEAHRVPSGFWKVVAMSGPGGLEVAAFIMDQDLPRGADFCAPAQRVGLAELERRTGLAFFPEHPRDGLDISVQNIVTISKRLGCDR